MGWVNDMDQGLYKTTDWWMIHFMLSSINIQPWLFDYNGSWMGRLLSITDNNLWQPRYDFNCIQQQNPQWMPCMWTWGVAFIARSAYLRGKWWKVTLLLTCKCKVEMPWSSFLDGSFKDFSMFIPTRGHDPIWLIFFKWVAQPPTSFAWFPKTTLHMALFSVFNGLKKANCSDERL